jgi:PAS domain S-box-containing protein
MIGTLDEGYIEKILETIPIELSVLDAEDKVLAWNKHDTRIFKRPKSAVGKNVRSCHPKKSLSKVEQIIAEMKQGSRDKARFYIDLKLEDEKIHKVLIEYYALRDQNGNYLGCLEASQDISDIQSLHGEKRLLD